MIQRDYTDAPALDYTFLRKKGIELIQQLSGSNWTDFNLHDPGVTILEILCYAITDLAYRTRFPLADLLAGSDGTINAEAHSFIPPERILSSAPLSINDFRKLIIDEVDEVTNVWLEPVQSSFAGGYIKGKFRVVIQADAWRYRQADTDEEKEVLEKNIISKIKSLLADYRNVAEDWDQIIILKPQKIEVSAQVSVSKMAIPEEVLAQIYFRIEQALNPRIRFFSEPELLSRGYKIEDVYAGPLLKHGILPDEALQPIRKEVDKADLIMGISELADVIHTRTLGLWEVGSPEDNGQPVILKPDHYPLLEFDPGSPGITLYYGDLPVPIKPSVFNSMLNRLHDTFRKDFIRDVHNANIQKREEGTYRRLQSYTSLQNLFPAIYRIGSEGVERDSPPLRKAQVHQLKAYLLFFEQVLADYAVQLANLDNLFSADINPSSAHTYFFQPLYSVPHVAMLIKAFTSQSGQPWESFTNDKQNAYAEGLRELTETDGTYRLRKHRLLDHLLSRFNLKPDNYPVILFEQLYLQGVSAGRVNEELAWKATLLKQVQPFTYYRLRGGRYGEGNEEKERPGFDTNMRLLLHIRSDRQRLSDVITLHSPTSGHEKPVTPDRKETDQTVEYKGEKLKIAVGNVDNGEVSSFYFPQQSARFFEWGINADNYRIVPGDDGRQYILYKNPAESTWRIVLRYDKEPDAQEGLRHIIGTVTNLSILSEGFHVVEHLLLAPPFDAAVFGFGFYDSRSNVLLRQRSRVSFADREDVVRQISSLAENTEMHEALDWLLRLSDLCLITDPDAVAGQPEQYLSSGTLKSMEPVALSMLYLRIRTNLSLFTKEGSQSQARFRYTVLHWDDSVIEETFFSSQVTVVFPSWPLRFQQEGFRRFAEMTFRAHLPVHIQVNFLWLPVSRMTRFENFFSGWQEAVKTGNPGSQRLELLLFIPFLRDELKKRKP